MNISAFLHETKFNTFCCHNKLDFVSGTSTYSILNWSKRVHIQLESKCLIVISRYLGIYYNRINFTWKNILIFREAGTYSDNFPSVKYKHYYCGIYTRKIVISLPMRCLFYQAVINCCRN